MAHPSTPVQAAVVLVTGASGLKDPEHRFGQLACLACHTITLKLKVAWEGEDPCAKTKDADVDGAGDVDLDEILIMPVPGGGSGKGKTLKFFAYDNVGIEDVLRGDPLIGEGELELTDDMLGTDQEIELTRDGKEHGTVTVHVTLDVREPREIVLCKAACLPELCVGAREEVMCHWGMALRRPGVGDKVDVFEANCLDFPHAGPIAIHGPRGIVDTSVEDPDWAEWKTRLEPARKAGGLVPPECQAKLDAAKTTRAMMSDEEWMSCFPGRRIDQFDTEIAVVGTSYMKQNEVEAFISDYLKNFPEYQCLDNSCQIFVKKFFTFLTSGKALHEMSDNEHLEGFAFFLELGNDR